MSTVNLNARAATSLTNSAAPAVEEKTVLPGQSPSGDYILSVLIKRTYDIVPDGVCVRANQDSKLIAGDRHFGDPQNSCVQYEADFVPFKLATDVVLNGHAHAPGYPAVDQLIASLTIADQRKDVLVIGDRKAHFREGAEPIFSDPKTFRKMPLRYEFAYGGVDVFSDPHVQTIYGRNHMGRGFVVANTRHTVDGLVLPNLEDPLDRLTPERLCVGHFMHWQRQPMPQSFGWFSKYWQPRAALAGVMPADREFEQQMRASYRTLVPPDQLSMYDQTQLPDMNFKFFNGASAGLVRPYLRGDETITASNLAPRSTLSFRLPGETPTIGLDIGQGMKSTPARLQTVMIRLDERQLDLVWRSGFPYPGPDWLPQMKKMEVSVS
jgi:hypothetical protein